MSVALRTELENEATACVDSTQVFVNVLKGYFCVYRRRLIVFLYSDKQDRALINYQYCYGTRTTHTEREKGSVILAEHVSVNAELHSVSLR